MALEPGPAVRADRDVVDDAAQRVERRIGMPVQATVRTRSQWQSARESFIREIKSRTMLPVLADAEQPFTPGPGALESEGGKAR